MAGLATLGTSSHISGETNGQKRTLRWTFGAHMLCDFPVVCEFSFLKYAMLCHFGGLLCNFPGTGTNGKSVHRARPAVHLPNPVCYTCPRNLFLQLCRNLPERFQYNIKTDARARSPFIRTRRGEIDPCASFWPFGRNQKTSKTAPESMPGAPTPSARTRRGGDRPLHICLVLGSLVKNVWAMLLRMTSKLVGV